MSLEQKQGSKEIKQWAVKVKKKEGIFKIRPDFYLVQNDKVL